MDLGRRVPPLDEPSCGPDPCAARVKQARRNWADALDIAVAETDAAGSLTWANSSFTCLLQEAGVPLTADADIRRILASFGDPDVPPALRGVERVLEGRIPSTSLLLSTPSRSSGRRWLRARLARLPSGAMLELVDVTDREEAMGELRLQVEINRTLAHQSGLLYDACQRILTAACRYLGWHGAALWAPSGGGGLHRVHLTVGDGAPLDVDVLGRASAGSAAAWALRSFAANKALQISDLQEAPRTDDDPFLAAGVRACLTVPLGSEGDVVAVAQLFSAHPRTASATSISMLRTAGAQLTARVLRDRAEQQALLADAQLREATAKLSSIMACAPVHILTTDRNGVITYLNRTDPPGHEADVVGRRWTDFLPSGDRGQHEKRLALVLRGEHHRYEASVLREDGSQRFYHCHIGPLTQDDTVVGAVIVAQDVTEQKKKEEEYLAAQRLASVGTLAAGIAHEINTPVQFVSDSLHFLEEASIDTFTAIDALVPLLEGVRAGAAPEVLAPLAEAAEEAVEDADLGYLREHLPPAFARSRDGLERVAKIVRSMKEFSHPDDEDAAPADLNRAIEATLVITRNEYKYVADLEMDLGELPPVRCFLSDINQVVLNLVVNAAHAVAERVEGTEERGTITVRTYLDGSNAHIEVSDTGTGIPEDVARRVFDPFFTTKEVGKGTGQGLALAWRVVREQHGGSIWFDTKVGKGTTFHVTIPVKGPRAACTEDAA